MAWYEVVGWVVIAFIVALTILGGIITITDSNRLKKENEKLKDDLKKARQRKIKNEYKKAKKVEEK